MHLRGRQEACSLLGGLSIVVTIASLISSAPVASAGMRDWSLDRSFGERGIIVPRGLHSDYPQPDYPGADYRGAEVAIDRQGRYLVGARHSPFPEPSETTTVFSRFRRSGDRDLTFGNRGTVRFPRFKVNWFQVDREGRIVFSDGASSSLARLKDDGSLDKGFGADGLAAAPPGFDVTTGTIDPDGRILVAGRYISSNSSDMAAARFLPSGALDASFGSGGISILPPPPGPMGSCGPGGYDAAASAVALDVEDRIVLAGTYGYRNDYYLFPGGCGGPAPSRVVRLLPSGDFDSSFGFGGASESLGTASVDGLVVDLKDRISVEATQFDSGGHGAPTQVTVDRFLRDGIRDPAFDRLYVAYPSEGAALQTDNEGRVLVIASVFSADPTEFSPAVRAIRLRKDGTVEDALTFGFGRPAGFGIAWGAAADPGGGLVISGQASPTGFAETPRVAIARLGAPCGGLGAIRGTSRRDRLVGTRLPDVVLGLGGGDTITTRGGEDTVCAGSGSDHVRTGPGSDRVDLGLGDDVAYGQAGKDLLLGEAGADALFGGRGDDRLFGGPGADVLRGGSGHDLTRGGPGQDRVIPDA